MAGKNERAATLPSNLRHGVTHTEENEGFFSKLRKKLKLKKGRYHVDVSTSECDNVAAVSFKKRESREILDDESPWKLRNPKLEDKNSPKSSKRSLNKQLEKHSLSIKGNERKLSNPETFSRTLNSSEINNFQRSSFGGKTKSVNEYSPLTYDTKDNFIDKTLKLRESALKNDHLLHDDSAIDLDTDVEHTTTAVSHAESANFDIGFDPGYEKLPDRRSQNIKKKIEKDTDPNYESIQEAKEKNNVKIESDFDPNYESVDEVKARMQQKVEKEEEFLIGDDPGYQSVKDVKRETPDRGTSGMRPSKTYSMNQSIESLDEPGYESLNDVKKRIVEQNFEKSCRKGTGAENLTSTTVNSSQSLTEVDDLNDSAIGSVPKSDCMLPVDLTENSAITSERNMFKSETNGGLQALAEAAVSLVGVATALTASSSSKDSGFESKDKSFDLEQSDTLYSSVKKKPNDQENPYSTVNKERKLTDEETENTHVITTEVPVDGYDSETELMLDPGYAECADAIKGVIPYSLYSEGSGSKMSSCTSLDMSAEDFVLEPGYAECADAIKSGAIKKISVSHERLVDHTVGSKHDSKVKGEISSEIYANPQILFRKRSKLIEEGNQENPTDNSDDIEASKDKSTPLEEEICLAVKGIDKTKKQKAKRTKEEKEVAREAPPIPARNYSLYLDTDEADQVINEVLQDCEINENNDISSLDDAFETELNSNQTAENLTKVEPKQSDNDVECVEISSCDQVEQIGNDKVSCDSCETGLGEQSGIELKQKEEIQEVKKLSFDGVNNLNVTGTNGEVMFSLASENCILEQSKGEHQVVSSKLFDTKDDEPSEETYQENKSIENVKQSTEDCLHVKVKDEKGLEKILKVVEKEESFQLQKKRESSRKKVNHCTGVVDNSNKSCDELEISDGSKIFQHTKETEDLQHFNPKSTNLQDTKDVKDLVEKDTCLKEDKCDLAGCDMKPETVTTGPTCTIQYPELSVIPDSSKHEHIESNGCSFLNYESETDSGKFLTVAVKMKCISVDSDSDFFNTEDLPKLEINESDLESPFDSSDNSNTLDIESESAGIKRLTQRLNTEDIPETCFKCSNVDSDIAKDVPANCCLEYNTVPKLEEGKSDERNTASANCHCDIKDIKEKKDTVAQADEAEQHCSFVSALEANFSESKEILHETDIYKSEACDDVFDSQISDRKATLNSRLCVIDSEIEGESDLSKLMGSYCNEVAANKVENYSSDDSAIGNGDDFKLNECHNCNDITSAHTHKNNVQDIRYTVESTPHNTNTVSSEELHLLYEKEHPNLYEDSEPTHMSLEEAMGLSPQNIQVSRSHSGGDGQSLECATSPNTLVLSNTCSSDVSKDSTVTPPPRPPPLANASQVMSRISIPDQSVEVKVVTPIDEVPTSVNLSFVCGPPGEDSPPAIPPRHRTVRTPRRPVSYSQDFMESMRQLKDCGWYWGPLSWEEAEHKLAKKPEGTFLVRDSSDEHYILSLSFKNQGRVHHTRIEHHKGHFSFWSQPDSHGKSTIKEFIDQCVENSRNGRFLYFIRPSGPGSPPMPIQLLNPVSRFVQMRSLQHMCRFRILQLVRRDHIDCLPVPTRIKQYLKEAQYYVEYLDD